MQLGILTLLVGAAACGKPPEQQAPPPQEVSFEAVSASTVGEAYEFVGTVQPFRRVEVRSSASGIITGRPFTEGSEVRAGQVLYEIDRTVYLAAERGADARLKNAERQVARLTPLVAERAVARRDLDDAETELLQAKAEYDRARKNLDDATVRAEISGRVGRALIELGGRVSGSADLLTTIDQVEPIYVSFRPSSQQLLAWRRSPQAAALLRPGSPLKISVTLPDGASLGRTGQLDYIDPVLEAGSGTQEFRAKFTNSDRVLVPGQFVRVKLEGFLNDSAITVPQRAVQQQMGRRVIYVVGPGDTVQVRDVEVGQWSGDRWIITKGLQVGDRVIVDGVQKTGPGAVVKPVPMATTPDSASAGSSPK
ncbi:MAG: efflux RND transporter periplasmic adaptor subunit [Gemmatimonadales bacterium]|nr:efflux RND transporter periplasmic adaptor subunit [Gemmatimonadales bacterium]